MVNKGGKNSVGKTKKASKSATSAKSVAEKSVPADFKTTADIKVSKNIINQVIGQDDAVEVMKKAAKQRRHVLLIGEPGTGKCVGKDTLIHTNKGIFSAEDLFNIANKSGIISKKDGVYARTVLRALSVDKNGKLVYNRIRMAYKGKKKKCLKIRTASGAAITLSGNHPLLTITEGSIGFLEGKCLKKGMHIGSVRHLPANDSIRLNGGLRQYKGKNNISSLKIQIPKQLSSNLAYLLGLYVAEGYYDGTIKIYNCNKDIQREIKRIVIEEFNYPEELFDVTANSVRILRSRTLADVFETVFDVSLERNKQASHKCIPAKIMNADMKAIGAFVSGYLDGDGYVGKQSIDFVSSSRSLIRDLKILLLKLGVVSRSKITHKKATNSNMGKKQYYYLCISGNSNVQNLEKYLCLKIGHKKHRLSLLSQKNCNTNVDIVPNIGNLLNELKKDADLRYCDLQVSSTTYNRIVRGTRNVSHELLKSLTLRLNYFSKTMQEQQIESEKCLDAINKFESKLGQFHSKVNENHVCKRTLQRYKKGEIEPSLKTILKVLGLKNIFAGKLFGNSRMSRIKEFIDNYRCLHHDLCERNKRIMQKLSVLNTAVNSDLWWDKIESIEPVHEQVFDFEVENTHNFVVNSGLVVHNSMLGMGLAEMLPLQDMQDIVSFANPNDENMPLIRTVKAGQGRKLMAEAKLQGNPFFRGGNLLMFIMAFIAMIAPWYVLQRYQSEIMFAALFVGGIIFVGLFAFFINFSRRMGSQKTAVPKVIVDNFGRKTAPFMDATGAHAGALLGDVLHDPFQTGGLGTPAHERVVAGMIHKTNMGVLFIDEIATLAPATQQDLLSALQERKFAITGQSERSAGAMVRTEAVPCLAPNTLIKINGQDIRIGKYVEKTLSKHKSMKIKAGQEIVASFVNKDKTISYYNTFQSDVPLLLYKSKYQGELIELELDKGIIQVTPEHPIITKQGVIKAAELKIGDSVVSYDANENVIISYADIIDTYSDELRRTAYAYITYCKLPKHMDKNSIAKLLSVNESTVRNWRKGAKPRAIRALEVLTSQDLCPLANTDNRLRLIARISGALFGDGGIVRNRLYFSTGLEAHKDIADFIEDATKIFGSSVKDKIAVRNTGKGFDISINSAYIARLFTALGVVKNDKVAQPFGVPKWVHEKPIVEKEFFSGLISSELYGNIRKISDTPSFGMAKIVRLEKAHILFLKEIQRYLNNNNVRTSTIKKSKLYYKKIPREKYEKAARYSFSLAYTHTDLLNFLKCINIVYADHKRQALQKVAEKSKEYLKNQKRLTAAYQRIICLRNEKETIRNIAKKLNLAKNTVWKKVQPTYKKYSSEFKKGILKKIRQGEKVNMIASSQNMPVATIRYWLKNENK